MAQSNISQVKVSKYSDVSGFEVNKILYHYKNGRFYKQAPYSDMGIVVALEEIFTAK